ncbi:MAG: hypothetical protein HY831_02055 [Candidatus Aenigmarchaeota archaeon]|nr:hypothetical protein [Candidatus Aenigmarchaeota archaeon]
MPEKRSEQRYAMAREKALALYSQGKYGSAIIEFRSAFKTAVDYSLRDKFKESAESLYDSLIANARALSERNQLSAAEQRVIEAITLAREYLEVKKQLSAHELLVELDETP